MLETADSYAVVQVFGPTQRDKHRDHIVSFLGETFMTHVSDDMLGRIFDGQGKPKDGGARDARRREEGHKRGAHESGSEADAQRLH